MEYLLEKAPPIQVAIIPVTIADSRRILLFKHKNLLCNQWMIATALTNSGGVILAKVECLAVVQLLPSRSMGIPGAMVDCLFIIIKEDQDYFHNMIFTRNYNSVLTGLVL